MDEHGEVSSVAVTVPRGDETLIRQGQVDDSFEEGDGGEIMVEVVGSDVLVNGISGNDGESGKEVLEREMDTVDGGGESGSGEAGDLEGDISDATAETRIEGGADVAQCSSEAVHLKVAATDLLPDAVTERGNNAIGEKVEGTMDEAMEECLVEGPKVIESVIVNQISQRVAATDTLPDEVSERSNDAIAEEAGAITDEKMEEGLVKGQKVIESVDGDQISQRNAATHTLPDAVGERSNDAIAEKVDATMDEVMEEGLVEENKVIDTTDGDQIPHRNAATDVLPDADLERSNDVIAERVDARTDEVAEEGLVEGDKVIESTDSDQMSQRNAVSDALADAVSERGHDAIAEKVDTQMDEVMEEGLVEVDKVTESTDSDQIARRVDVTDMLLDTVSQRGNDFITKKVDARMDEVMTEDLIEGDKVIESTDESGINSHQTSQRVGDLDDEVWNPGIDDAAPSSSLLSESQNRHTPLSGEVSAVNSIDEGFCAGQVNQSCDVEDGVPSSGHNHSALSETTCEAIVTSFDSEASGHNLAHSAGASEPMDLGIADIQEDFSSVAEVGGSCIPLPDSQPVGEGQAIETRSNVGIVTSGHLNVLSFNNSVNGDACSVGANNDGQAPLEPFCEVSKDADFTGSSQNVVEVALPSNESVSFIEQSSTIPGDSVITPSASGSQREVYSGEEGTDAETRTFGSFNDASKEHQEGMTVVVNQCLKSDVVMSMEAEASISQVGDRNVLAVVNSDDVGTIVVSSSVEMSINVEASTVDSARPVTYPEDLQRMNFSPEYSGILPLQPSTERESPQTNESLPPIGSEAAETDATKGRSSSANGESLQGLDVDGRIQHDIEQVDLGSSDYLSPSATAVESCFNNDIVVKDGAEVYTKDNQSIVLSIELDSGELTSLSCRQDERAAQLDSDATAEILESEPLEVDVDGCNDMKESTPHTEENARKEDVVGANVVLTEQISAASPAESMPQCHDALKAPGSDASDGIITLSVEAEELKVDATMTMSESATVSNFSTSGNGGGLGDNDLKTINSDVGCSISFQGPEREITLQHTDMDLEQVDPADAETPPVIQVAGIQVAAGAVSVLGDVDSVGPKAEGDAEILPPLLSDGSLPEIDQTLGTSTCHSAASDVIISQTIEMELINENDPELHSLDSKQEPEIENDMHGGELVSDREQEEEESKIHASGTEQLNILDEKDSKVINSSLYPGYFFPSVDYDSFCVSDLVWGKVRSHPWWPGQIFDPADASEKAVKYYKKDSFLVAYFGDRTFAWNDASVLKPFHSCFSQIEKQSNSEAFQNAVSCALEEVSRRVQLGLACSCILKDVSQKIECQIVENTGIREDASRRYGVDKSTAVDSFDPHKLLEYLKTLAVAPHSGADRLDLVVAKAQLSGYCRYKGYCLPPEFLFTESLSNDDIDILQSSDEVNYSNQDGEPKVSCHKRKSSGKDGLQPKKKEKSLSELMVDTDDSPESEDSLDAKALGKSPSSSTGRKRKAVDSLADGYDKRISIYAAKVSSTFPPSSKQSFKIGECIQRVASQLTGSTSIQKCSSDQPGTAVCTQMSPGSERGEPPFPIELASPNEMLLQLHLAARDPLKEQSFLNTILPFFSCFRDSFVVSQRSGRHMSSIGRPGRKKKISQSIADASEEFEFDDINDSYWTDRIVQNYPEEQLLENEETGGGELVALEPDKSLKSGRRSHSRKRYFIEDHEMAADGSENHIDKTKQGLLPAEVILSFTGDDPLPSEISLNKIFRRFGPLKELETEVDRESSRAKVVFKRGSDAEVAHSSLVKFNIFGSRPVSYQLSYIPSVSIKTLSNAVAQVQENAT